MKKTHFMCAIMAASLIMPHKTKAQSPDGNYVMCHTMLDSKGKSDCMALQYYDGLGRPTQTADRGAGNGAGYVHTLVEYDHLGRETARWIQIRNDSSGELSKEAFSSALGGTHGCSATTYDALSRPVFVSTPGQAWNEAGKGIKKNHVTNGNDVKRYAIENGSSLSQSYYPACSLTGEETIDEDGHSVIVFKDLMNNVVLERRNGSNNTYYVYNDKCQLAFVLPPAVDSLAAGRVSPDVIGMYAYKYEYDDHGRCTKKTFPGCKYTQYWYDIYGRTAYMQDGRMRDAGKYRFYFYDSLNRLAVQGICDGLPSNTESLHADADYETGDSYVGHTGYKVKNGHIPSNMQVEIVNYYDNYDFLANSAVCTNHIGPANLSDTCHANATSLLTGRIVSTSSGDFLCSAIYYNEKGNQIAMRETVLGGGTICTATHYTFTDKPDTISKTLTKNGVTRTTKLTCAYDSTTDKLSFQRHNYNNKGDVTISSYEYDELGRVKSEYKHDGNIANTFRYDIHGWATNIRSEVSASDSLLFDEAIHYADGPGAHCYNGNISCTKHITHDHPMGTNTFYAYKYCYDKLGRLTKAHYGYGPTNHPVYMDFNMLDEEVTYDANSNIMSLVRHGAYGDGVIDNLTYSYKGNRIYGIHDSAQNVLSAGFYDFKDNKIKVPNAPEYGYDDCGSITYDTNKGVTRIEYDFSGNPTRIQLADYNVTEYVYSADGRLLKSIHRTAVPQGRLLNLGETHQLTASETFSIDSTEYINDFEFKNGTLSMCKFDGGYMAPPFNNSTYRYYITDHLGNNSLVVNGCGDVLQATHYYPFGSIHNTSKGQGCQTYKYCNKEFDEMHGLNTYDYGARQYDPATCRFTSMDPLCERSYHITPYAYCGGNPVNRVDPDGQDWYVHNGQRKWFNSISHKYMDSSKNLWTNIGRTYVNPATGAYYSLFGQVYSKDNKDLNAIKTIDAYVQSYARYLANYEESNEVSAYSKVTATCSSELPSQPTIRANMYKYEKSNWWEKIFEEKNNHIFSYGGNAHNALVRMPEDNRWITNGQILQDDMNTANYFGNRFSGKGIWLRNNGNFEIVTIIFSKEIGIRNNSFFNKLIKSWENGKWNQ